MKNGSVPVHGTKTASFRQDKPLGESRSRSEELIRARLPKGVKLGQFSDGRGKPFFVRWGTPRRVESFATEAERNERALELADMQVEHGMQVMRFDPREWEEFKQWKARRAKLRLNANLGQAVEDYLAERTKEGLAADSVRHIRSHLGRFVAHCGEGLAMTYVSAEDISDWLTHLHEKQGYEGVTCRHHRKDLNVFLKWALRRKLIDENPCELVPAPKVEVSDDVAVLKLKEVWDFFRANAGERSIGRLALEAFGGLRHSSAARASLEDLDFENRAVTLPRTKHKLGRRFYVDGWPENLWEWLRVAPKSGWDVKPRSYGQDKAFAFARASVTNEGNVFRHTFATMHLAAFKDAPALAVLLTHRDINMLLAHYRGRGVTEAVGKAFFQITPQTVQLTWAQFAKRCGVSP